MHYTLQSDWSLLFLVNIQGSLHYKQGMLLVNIYINKVACGQHHLQLPVIYETESTTSCQYMLPSC